MGCPSTAYQSTDNHVQGNQIGTNAAGSARLPNGGSGVWIYSSPANTVGAHPQGRGTSSRAIPQRYRDRRSPRQRNQVLGNKIGTNAAGTASLYNGLSGIYLGYAPENIIGGASQWGGEPDLRQPGEWIYLAPVIRPCRAIRSGRT